MGQFKVRKWPFYEDVRPSKFMVAGVAVGGWLWEAPEAPVWRRAWDDVRDVPPSINFCCDRPACVRINYH